MRLQGGQINGHGGESAWKLFDNAGTPIKEFFVTKVASVPITAEITMLVGAALSEDELNEVYVEIERRNPGRDVDWRRRVQWFTPEA